MGARSCYITEDVSSLGINHASAEPYELDNDEIFAGAAATDPLDIDEYDLDK